MTYPQIVPPTDDGPDITDKDIAEALKLLRKQSGRPPVSQPRRIQLDDQDLTDEDVLEAYLSLSKAPEAKAYGDLDTEGKYSQLAIREAKAAGLDPRIVLAMMRQESRDDPKATSRVGSDTYAGLMQVGDGVAAKYGVTDRYNPEQNLRAGSKHMAYLMRKYNGDLDRSLAAYNAGEGAVTSDTKASTFRNYTNIEKYKPLPIGQRPYAGSTGEYIDKIKRRISGLQKYGKSKPASAVSQPRITPSMPSAKQPTESPTSGVQSSTPEPTFPNQVAPVTDPYKLDKGRYKDTVEADNESRRAEFKSFDIWNRPIKGLTAPGTIDVINRKAGTAPSGEKSRVYSAGVNVGGEEVLLSSFDEGGNLLGDPDTPEGIRAIVGYYKETGLHLGKFDSPEASSAFGRQLSGELSEGKWSPPRLRRNLEDGTEIIESENQDGLTPAFGVRYADANGKTYLVLGDKARDEEEEKTEIFKLESGTVLTKDEDQSGMENGAIRMVDPDKNKYIATPDPKAPSGYSVTMLTEKGVEVPGSADLLKVASTKHYPAIKEVAPDKDEGFVEVSKRDAKTILRRGSAGTFGIDLSQKPSGAHTGRWVLELALLKVAKRFRFSQKEISDYLDFRQANGLKFTVYSDNYTDEDVSVIVGQLGNKLYPFHLTYGGLQELLQWKKTGALSKSDDYLLPEIQEDVDKRAQKSSKFGEVEQKNISRRSSIVESEQQAEARVRENALNPTGSDWLGRQVGELLETFMADPFFSNDDPFSNADDPFYEPELALHSSDPLVVQANREIRATKFMEEQKAVYGSYSNVLKKQKWLDDQIKKMGWGETLVRHGTQIVRTAANFVISIPSTLMVMHRAFESLAVPDARTPQGMLIRALNPINAVSNGFIALEQALSGDMTTDSLAKALQDDALADLDKTRAYSALTTLKEYIGDDEFVSSTEAGKWIAGLESAALFMAGGYIFSGSRLAVAMLGMGSEISGMYEEMKKNGVPENLALIASTIFGGISGGSEIVGVGGMAHKYLNLYKLGSELSEGGMKTFLKAFFEVGKGMAREIKREGPEEGFQSLFQGALNHVAVDAMSQADKSVIERFKGMLDRDRIIEGIAKSVPDAVMGFAIGSTFGSASFLVKEGLMTKQAMSAMAGIKSSSVWTTLAKLAEKAEGLVREGDVLEAQGKTKEAEAKYEEANKAADELIAKTQEFDTDISEAEFIEDHIDEQLVRIRSEIIAEGKIPKSKIEEEAVKRVLSERPKLEEEAKALYAFQKELVQAEKGQTSEVGEEEGTIQALQSRRDEIDDTIMASIDGTTSISKDEYDTLWNEKIGIEEQIAQLKQTSPQEARIEEIEKIIMDSVDGTAPISKQEYDTLWNEKIALEKAGKEVAPEAKPLPETQSALDAQLGAVKDGEQTDRVAVLYEKGNEDQAPKGRAASGMWRVVDPFGRGGGVLLVDRAKAEAKGITNRAELVTRLKDEGDTLLQSLLGRVEAVENTNETDTVVEVVDKDGKQVDASAVSAEKVDEQIETSKRVYPDKEVRENTTEGTLVDRATDLVEEEEQQVAEPDGLSPGDKVSGPLKVGDKVTVGQGTQSQTGIIKKIGEVAQTNVNEPAQQTYEVEYDKYPGQTYTAGESLITKAESLSPGDKVAKAKPKETKVKAEKKEAKKKEPVVKAESKAETKPKAKAKTVKERGTFELPQREKKEEDDRERYTVDNGDKFTFEQEGETVSGTVDNVTPKGVYYHDDSDGKRRFVKKTALESKEAKLKPGVKAKVEPKVKKVPTKAKQIYEMPLEKYQQNERQSKIAEINALADEKNLTGERRATFVNLAVTRALNAVNKKAETEHKKAVKEAVKAGKAVPDKILSSYPAIAKAAGVRVVSKDDVKATEMTGDPLTYVAKGRTDTDRTLDGKKLSDGDVVVNDRGRVVGQLDHVRIKLLKRAKVVPTSDSEATVDNTEHRLRVIGADGNAFELPSSNYRKANKEEVKKYEEDKAKAEKVKEIRGSLARGGLLPDTQPRMYSSIFDDPDKPVKSRDKYSPTMTDEEVEDLQKRIQDAIMDFFKARGLRFNAPVFTPYLSKSDLPDSWLTAWGNDPKSIAKALRSAGEQNDWLSDSLPEKLSEKVFYPVMKALGLVDKQRMADPKPILVYRNAYYELADIIENAGSLQGAEYDLAFPNQASLARASDVENDAQINDLLESVKGKALDKLARNAALEVTNGFEITPNLEANEFIRQIAGLPTNKGFVLEPAEAKELVKKMRDAVRRYRRKDSKANVLEMARQIEKATREGEGIPLFVFTPSVLTEERFHRLALLNSLAKKVGGLLPSKSITKLMKLMPDGVKETLGAQGYDTDPVLVNETVAKIASGEIVWEGAEEFLVTWAEEYANFNNVKSMADFRKLNDFTDKAMTEIDVRLRGEEARELEDVSESLEDDLAIPKKKEEKKDVKRKKESNGERNARVSKEQEQATKDTVRIDEEEVSTSKGKRKVTAKERKQTTKLVEEKLKNAQDIEDILLGNQPHSYTETVQTKLADTYADPTDYVPVSHREQTQQAEQVLQDEGERRVLDILETTLDTGGVPSQPIIRAAQIISTNRRKALRQAEESEENDTVIEAMSKEHNKLIRMLAVVVERTGRASESVKAQLEDELDVVGRLTRARLRAITDKGVRQEVEDGEEPIVSKEEKKKLRELEKKLEKVLDELEKIKKENAKLRKERAVNTASQKASFEVLKNQVDKDFEENETFLSKYFDSIASKASLARPVSQPTVDGGVLDDLPVTVQKALVDYATSILINRLFETKKTKSNPDPKPAVPISVEEFDKRLSELSKGNLTKEQVARVHADAISAIKDTQRGSAGMKDLAKIRLKHYRRADNTEKGLPDIFTTIEEEVDNPTSQMVKNMFGEKSKEFLPYREEIKLGAVASAENPDWNLNRIASYINGLVGGKLSPQEQINLARASVFLVDFAKKKYTARLDEINDRSEEIKEERKIKAKELGSTRRHIDNQIKILSKSTVVPSRFKAVEKLRYATKWTGDIIRRLDRIHTGQAIASIATNITNEITSIGAGTVSGFEAATDLMFQRMGMEGGEMSPDASENMRNQITLGLSMVGLDKNFKNPLMYTVGNLYQTYGTAQEILAQFPEEFVKLFGDIIPDIYSHETVGDKGAVAKSASKILNGVGTAFEGLESASKALLTINFASESKNRAAVFVHTLRTLADGRARVSGSNTKTLDEMIESGDYSDFTPKDFDRAIRRALLLTFAAMPRNFIARKVVMGIQKVPLLLNPLRFARVAYNLAEFGFSRLPPYTVAKALAKGLSPDKFGGHNTSEDMSKMVSGFVMQGIAFAIRSIYGGDDKDWYMVRIPGTDTKIDIRRYQPFSMYYFLADRSIRLYQGHSVFNADWETLEGIAPLNFGFYNAAYEVLFKSNLANDWISGRGGKDIPSELNVDGIAMADPDLAEKLRKEYENNNGDMSIYQYHTQRFVGGNIATLLNGLGNIQDVMNAFFNDQTMPDSIRSPIFGPIEREIPFSKMAKALGIQGDNPVPVVEDPITGMPKRFGNPLMRMIGMPVALPEGYERYPTIAESKAESLLGPQYFRQEIPSEQQRKMVVNSLIRAVRNGYITTEQFKQRLTFYTLNSLADRDGKRIKEGVITPTQADEAFNRGTTLRLNANANRLSHAITNSDFMKVFNLTTEKEREAGMGQMKLEKDARLIQQAKTDKAKLGEVKVMELYRDGKVVEYNQAMGKLTPAQQTDLGKKFNMTPEDFTFMGKSNSEKLYLFRNQSFDKKIRYYALMQNKTIKNHLEFRDYRKKPLKALEGDQAQIVAEIIKFNGELRELFKSDPVKYKGYMKTIAEVGVAMEGRMPRIKK